MSEGGSAGRHGHRFLSVIHIDIQLIEAVNHKKVNKEQTKLKSCEISLVTFVKEKSHTSTSDCPTW